MYIIWLGTLKSKGMIVVTMTRVEIDVSEGIVPYKGTYDRDKR